MPISKVQQLSKGAKLISIPKTLAELFNISKGDILEWEMKEDKLCLKKVIKKL